MEDVVTKIRDRLAKPPGMGRSDHSEIAFIVEDVPGIILPLRNKLFDFLDERGVLIVTLINGHIFGEPGRKNTQLDPPLLLSPPTLFVLEYNYHLPDHGPLSCLL